MEAIIRTNDTNVFNSLLQFLKSLHIVVETKEAEEIPMRKDEKLGANKTKKFNPDEYKGILNLKNIDIEKELLNMRKGWKKRNF